VRTVHGVLHLPGLRLEITAGRKQDSMRPWSHDG